MPNPAQSFLKVESSLPGAAIEVFGLNGQKVAKFAMPESAIEIDVSKWARSIYLFRYSLPDGTSGSSRVVLQ
jgi:hypothetical protein